MIRLSGNITLGHSVLLGAMFEAAVVIGGMSCNPGWLGAGLVWATSIVFVLRYPNVQDYTLGAAMVVGFGLVGYFRWSLHTRSDNESLQDIGAR